MLGAIDITVVVVYAVVPFALGMAVAMVTAKPLLDNFDQAFQYIQEFTVPVTNIRHVR